MKKSEQGTRRGSVMVLALLLVLVVAGLAAAFTEMSLSFSRRQGAANDNKRAFYIAEAGLAEAYWGLATGSGARIGSIEEPAVFGGGVVWVDAEYEDDVVRLESTGMFNGGRATLGLVATREQETVGAKGLFSVEDLEIGNNILIDGYDSSLGPYEDQIDPDDEVPHAKSGALVESSGSITVTSGSGTPTHVFGDANPAPFGTTTVSGSAVVTGSTAPLPTLEALPPVQLPDLASEGSLDHRDGAPLVLPPGEHAYDTLHIGPGAEVVLRSPSVLLCSDITLDKDATLTLDDGDGNIDVFVKKSLVLNSGAGLTTVAEDPTKVTVQVAASLNNSSPDKGGKGGGKKAEEGGGGGKGAHVQFHSGTRLHAMVYAPQAHVSISNGFELFGGLAARRVDLSSGIELHVDRRLLAEGADALPRITSWRVLDIPADIARRRTDPFQALGVDPTTLPAPADAHGSLWIQVKFTDVDGVKQNYEGWTEGMDWSLVVSMSMYKAWSSETKEKLVFTKY